MSYKDTVLPIIRESRSITLPGWGCANITHEKSLHPADVVTELDIKVEEFLKEKLAEVYPEITFVGEEHGGDRDANKFWLCDPIDATGHYIRGLPFCTTMLALIENGIVIFSVVYDFTTDTMYHAERGHGAYMNDKQIHVSDRTLAQGYVAVETKMGKEENSKTFISFEDKTGYFHSISAGWEFAQVAQGKLDARVGFDPWGKDYDFAPGSLLVSEAGGIVTNIGSDKYDYKNRDLIAGNPKVHSELAEILKDYKSLQ